jgi:3-oxoacyl-[acyl-carrier-protein] synthase II
VRDFQVTDFIDKKMSRRLDRYAQYGVSAAMLALEDSGYPISKDPYAVGALIGSGVGGLDTFLEQTGVLLEKGPTRLSPFFIPMMIPNMASAMSSVLLGLKGAVDATCTACAAGTNALGDAFSIIRRGDATAMFAGGAEAAVNEVGIGAFAAARALSTRNDEPEKASRPFDAGRDAFHLTEPDETGKPAGLAMSRAIRDAGIDPSEVDYINAHGTSTPLGDAMETKAIKLSLGAHADRVMVSSTKSIFGHCLGAAGGLEAAATVLAMEAGKVPPTINLDDPDPLCDLDYVPNMAREAQVEVAMSNSFGFGGHNVAVVFRAWRG